VIMTRVRTDITVFCNRLRKNPAHPAVKREEEEDWGR
jgi:hypothetical protein